MIAQPLTIPGVLEWTAARFPDDAALVEGDRRLSFAELHGRVRDAARGFMGAGVQAGDTIGIWAPNSIEWAIASLAVLFAGATVVPINTRYTAVEAEDILVRSHCRLVVASEGFMGRDLAEEAAGLAAGVGVLAASAVGSGAVGSGVGAPDAALDARLAAVTPDDISHIQFTSGTTGRPKGAMLRHGPMVRTTADWAGVVGLRHGDRYPIVAPFSHIGGHKTGLLATITAGATAYPCATLDLEGLTAIIEQAAVTVLQGPPTMFFDLVSWARKEPERFSSLRVAVTGAAVVPPSLVRDLLDVVGLDAVFTAYGLTETTGVCTITRAGDPVAVIAETSGRSIAGVDVRIVDPDGTPLLPGQQGEIVVHGFHLMAGYLDDPAATAEAVREGWLHTGDIGWIGDDGNLRIVDRLKDMVIVGGLNAYPAEIERVLLEHPAVAQVAVIGVADERRGEVPAAFVVPAAGFEVDADDLRAFARPRLASFKIPRHVWVVESLPLNSAGKVQKSELRAAAAARLQTL